MRDKRKKTKIKLKKLKKTTEIRETVSLQKEKYYNIITMKNRIKKKYKGVGKC